MALIDDAKTALRVSTDEPDIIGQIQRLIEEAKLDLVRTADVRDDLVQTDEPDALIKGAILCYCGFVWTSDAAEKAKLKSCYDDYKAKLAMSSAYSTY